MALKLNIWNGIGRLTAEPERRQTADGKTLCSFSLAVPRPKTNDKTDFINFTAWGQPATFITTYGHKGDRCVISGALHSDQFTDKEGNKRTKFYINVQDMTLEAKGDNKEVPVSEGNISGGWDDMGTDTEGLPF